MLVWMTAEAWPVIHYWSVMLSCDGRRHTKGLEHEENVYTYTYTVLPGIGLFVDD